MPRVPCATVPKVNRNEVINYDSNFFSPPGNDSFREDLRFGGIYYFFSSRNLRAPSADRRKNLQDARSCVQFYNFGPKFWWNLSPKILGAKNMENLALFQSTSKFGGEYLRNGWRYSKLVSYPIDRYSSRIRRNKSGEIWSSNLGDLDVELYPPKVHFSEDRISVESLGRAAPPPQFLHALENDQVLLTHPSPGTLPIFFSKEGSKIGLM